METKLSFSCQNLHFAAAEMDPGTAPGTHTLIRPIDRGLRLTSTVPMNSASYFVRASKQRYTTGRYSSPKNTVAMLQACCAFGSTGSGSALPTGRRAGRHFEK